MTIIKNTNLKARITNYTTKKLVLKDIVSTDNKYLVSNYELSLRTKRGKDLYKSGIEETKDFYFNGDIEINNEGKILKISNPNFKVNKNVSENNIEVPKKGIKQEKGKVRKTFEIEKNIYNELMELKKNNDRFQYARFTDLVKEAIKDFIINNQ